jgi:hypothetical protein
MMSGNCDSNENLKVVGAIIAPSRVAIMGTLATGAAILGLGTLRKVRIGDD